MPTTTAKQRPTRIDDVTWQFFVKACGERCCECGADGKLHQGHIQRHADGGLLAFENLIPLCKSCNGKHNNGFTPDSRPAGWRDAFWKLLLTENHTGVRCKHPKDGVNTLPLDKVAESTGFLDLRNVEFVSRICYITPSASTSNPRPMLPAEAEVLVRVLIKKSRETSITPKRPFGKRQNTMKLLAIRHGEEAFGIAGDEFLREAPWVLDKDRETVQQDSWLHFCDSFEDYLADARERAVRIAEQAKVERERERVRQAEAVVYQRQMRWNDYIRTANLQPWPGMPEGDAEIIAAVAAEKAAAAEAQDVTEECWQQSLAVFRRWKFYKTDELLSEKQKLYDKLRQCTAWASQYEAKSQLEYANTIKEFKDWIDREKNVENLRNESYDIDYLYQDLDPSRPVFDPDTVPF